MIGQPLIETKPVMDPREGIPKIVLDGTHCAGCGVELRSCGVAGGVRLHGLVLDICNACNGMALRLLATWINRRMRKWISESVIP